jgi:hypothetical protein
MLMSARGTIVLRFAGFGSGTALGAARSWQFSFVQILWKNSFRRISDLNSVLF